MKFFYSLAILIAFSNAFAANSLWHKTSARNLQLPGERKIIPQKTSLVKLDDASFKQFKQQIPKEETGQFTLMTLPVPNGTEKSFRVFERTCMEKELADRYPNIKTYEAISVDDPNVVAKLDYTEFGFHAMVFSNEGTYFIDPYSNTNTGYYNCYYKKDYTRASGIYSVCETPERDAANLLNRSTNSTALVPDTKRRTFRLALAGTIEYSAAVGGPTPTKATVLSAIVSSINRVNGVYEKELSIHMNLVAKEDTLIFISSDSYSNSNGFSMLGQNQTICDNRIGTANYDIGHVFSTGGGGIAGLGVVCDDSQKANGVTGSPDPTGDGFDIDYVVHEMGHQFGADHTFNAVSGACAGNRESTAAYEVGSATTIMGYAGICDQNDVQLHSDDYFHRISIEQIYTYISSTACASIATTTNTPPTVSSYVNTYYIPYKTDFEITAAATDPHSLPLTYCWEEWDLGPSGNWNVSNNTTAPILRSYNPTSSPTRVFPHWDSLITNSIKFIGEILPEVARDVKFRCTVRNISGGWGIFNAPSNDLTLKAIVTPSLFRVTSNAATATITGNALLPVTWDVANTTASPISCASVDIYLSLDSARTFPYLLASGVPNNGSASVLIPNVSTLTSSARIKVKGTGNVFFDLNNGWIKINAAVVGTATALFTASDSVVCQGTSVTFTNSSTGSPDSVRWTLTGTTPLTSTSNTTLTATYNTPGTYLVTLVAYKGGVGSPVFFRNVTVNANKTTNLSQTICTGQSVTVGLQTFNTNGLHTVILQTSRGCDSTVNLTLAVNPTKTTNLSQTICNGESVTIGTQTFTTAGLHTVHLQTSKGCDSAVNLTLALNPLKTTNFSQTICAGENVMVGAQSFTTPGLHTVHLSTSFGCDSTVNLNLSVTALPAKPVLSTRNDSLVVTGSAGTQYKWYLNGNLQGTTNIPQFKITSQGSWTVIVVANSCQSPVADALLITGLRIHSLDVSFSIAPNPNSGDFEVKLSAVKPGKYEIAMYNVTGQEILKEEMNIMQGENTMRYNLNIEKGMYFISVTGNDGIVTKNIIVQ
ncbi:MAG: hypothetical protein JWN78_193 [Bacteroidota bacterium]|nr:hypothetical protein [Bacteroidota bacterium]